MTVVAITGISSGIGPALLSQLVVKEPEQKKGLQTSSIRDKLVAMGSAFESEEGEDA